MDFNNPEFIKNEVHTSSDMSGDLREITVTSWFLYILLILIPGVNLVFLLSCALSERNNKNLRYFARAAIIWMVIFVIFSIIVVNRIL